MQKIVSRLFSLHPYMANKEFRSDYTFMILGIWSLINYICAQCQNCLHRTTTRSLVFPISLKITEELRFFSRCVAGFCCLLLQNLRQAILLLLSLILLLQCVSMTYVLDTTCIVMLINCCIVLLISGIALKYSYQLYLVYKSILFNNYDFYFFFFIDNNSLNR